MQEYKTVNTYIDTLGIRCVCDGIYQRTSLFKTLINFLRARNIVGIKYNKEKSTKYYQITELLHGNTKIASIDRGYYQNDNNSFNPDYYYINISFYGLKRYSKIKDEASLLLVRTITAFLNTYNIDFKLIELDIAMDVQAPIDNILAVCVRRSPNIEYYQLGDSYSNGETIQEDIGTYYLENFKSFKQKKNATSRAYLYDKRLKEQTKFQKDIGFNLTRFEVKLQKRFFVKNISEFISIYRALNKYTLLEFKDIEQKVQLIQKLNSVTTSKQRRKAIDDVIEDNNAISLTQKMISVGSLLSEIGNIRLNPQGDFVLQEHKSYFKDISKFYKR